MSQLFAADAMLITGGRDTIRGRADIQQYFATSLPGARTAKFWFAREPSLNVCFDGAYEHALFTAEVRDSAGASDTLRGRFVVRWVRDSLGQAVVHLAAFTEQDYTRRLRRAECISPETVLQQSSRLSLTLFPGPQPTLGGPYSGLETAMREHGWNDEAFVCPSPNPCTSTRTPRSYRAKPTPVLPTLGEVRYRLSQRVAAGLVVGSSSHGVCVGVNTLASSEVDMSWTGQFAAATLSYEPWVFRFGGGPAFQTAHWDILERASPDNGFIRYRTSFRTNAVGFVTNLGAKLPVVGRIYVDFTAEARRFLKANVRGTPRFPPVKVSDDTYFVGLGVGIAL